MSEPGYNELQSCSPRTRDYARGIREDGCPECDHDSLVVTQAMVATRIDPACWSGYCTCAERNREQREGEALGCTECLDTHELLYCDECWDCHDSFEGLECGCECHCGCDFET